MIEDSKFFATLEKMLVSVSVTEASFRFSQFFHDAVYLVDELELVVLSRLIKIRHYCFTFLSQS